MVTCAAVRIKICPPGSMVTVPKSRLSSVIFSGLSLVTVTSFDSAMGLLLWLVLVSLLVPHGIYPYSVVNLEIREKLGCGYPQFHCMQTGFNIRFDF